MRRVGLISDTHGHVSDEALDALAGVDLIIHAGDVGVLDVLAGLETIAPVRAVRGNMDRSGETSALPSTLDLDVEGVSVHVTHHRPVRPPEGVQVVVSGHSHRPSVRERRGVLMVDPGSASRGRGPQGCTVGRLDVADGRVAAHIVRV